MNHFEHTTADNRQAQPRPRRIRFGPFAGAPIALIPDHHLSLLAGLARGRVRVAVLDELRLRRGSDRSGPRLVSWSPAWDSL